jgi:DeoR/GlpR family transcriptional regulator of sugar metabolism
LNARATSCIFVQLRESGRQPVLTQQRKRLILERLRKTGQVVAAELSAELTISEDTIRRDLRGLAAEGLLQRVHGGALPASPATADMTVRGNVEMDCKRDIATRAASVVQDGQVVFVDGGTTCEQLARQLAPDLKATVVTHSPTTACALGDHKSVEVVLVGGRLFKHSMVAVGAAASEAIGRVRADIYFMGATGVRAREGISTGDLEEAHIKRAMLLAAAETWVLASPEKLEAASAYTIAACREVTGLILSRTTPKPVTRAFEKLGLKCMRA